MRVEQFLSDSATRYGQKPAIVSGGRPHSYAYLARSSDRVAAALVQRGIGRGDRVALFMDDNFEAVVSAFAVLKAGAVASPIDPVTDAETLALVLAETGAAAIFTEARRASVAAAAMASARGVRLVVLCGGDRSTAAGSCLSFEDLVGGIGPGPRVDRAGPASDPALVLHPAVAGGSLEVATLTHSEVIAAAVAADRGTRILSSILSHHGLCQLLAAIRAGTTLVLDAPSALRRSAYIPGGETAVVALAS